MKYLHYILLFHVFIFQKECFNVTDNEKSENDLALRLARQVSKSSQVKVMTLTFFFGAERT